jgi:hypothetical protein
MNAKICSGLVFVLEFEKRYTLYIWVFVLLILVELLTITT